MSFSDASLREIREELHSLVALADSAGRPKPTRINGLDHAMPGHEWVVEEIRGPHDPLGRRRDEWVIRTADEDKATGEGIVYLSTPDSMHPGRDFRANYTAVARRLAMAVLAACDRADHQAREVPRLEDHRTPEREQP